MSFYINGQLHTVSGNDVFQTLSSYLRYQSRLTGTKVVCAEGDCGACTVLMARGEGGYRSMNSCIAMTFAMDGASLVTVEGMGKASGLCEIQNSMVRNFGGQCGFCTPGFVMSIANMHEQQAELTEQKAKNYLTGNLCRCTGYSPIIKAACDVDRKKQKPVGKAYPQQIQPKLLKQSVLISGDECEYFAPTSWKEACKYKAKGDVVVFSGATDLGVIYNKGKLRPRRVMSLHLIPDFTKLAMNSKTVQMGAGVTLTQFQNAIAKTIPALSRFINIFASPQIKNVATVVGNLANASPIAEMPPPLMVLEATVEIIGLKGKKSIPLSEFYLAYKKIKLGKDELITGVTVPIPGSKDYFENYKVSQRRDLDISTVNASFRFSMEGSKIKHAFIAYGGVAATTVRLNKLEKSLEGKVVDSELIRKTTETIRTSIKPLSDVRGSSNYRLQLSANLFQKFADQCLTK